MAIEYKQVTAELKALDDQGIGSLRFIKFDAEDKDSDVTHAGFIGHQRAHLLPNHNWKSDRPPIGDGESYEDSAGTYFRYQLNLDTHLGQEWYKHLKFALRRGPDHSLQQVSYGFSPYADGQERTQKAGRSIRILKPRPDGSPGATLHEVSFVIVGAGVDTAVLDVKSFEELPEPEEDPRPFDDLKAAGVRIQSLIFPKSKWESAEAVRSWLSSHDYSTALDATGSSWRARQEDPGRFQRLRSFCINPSRDASAEACRVMAVGGPMKESRSMADSPTGIVADVKRIIGVHSTATDERPWNFAIEHRQVKGAQSGGFYRNLFAVQDPGKESQRGNYRYLHHRIDGDGHPGAASVIACSQILHTLHKGLIPPDERQGVYAHMAQHLREAGIEPPTLGDIDSYVYPYDEEAKLFLWQVDDILLQTGNIHDWRTKKGMSLSQERLDQFERMDQKWAALRLLLSVKGLDRPFDELLEHMTVEARGEAVADRMEKLAAKAQHDSETAHREMTSSVVARLLPKLH